MSHIDVHVEKPPGMDLGIDLLSMHVYKFTEDGAIRKFAEEKDLKGKELYSIDGVRVHGVEDTAKALMGKTKMTLRFIPSRIPKEYQSLRILMDKEVAGTAKLAEIYKRKDEPLGLQVDDNLIVIGVVRGSPADRIMKQYVKEYKVIAINSELVKRKSDMLMEIRKAERTVQQPLRVWVERFYSTEEVNNMTKRKKNNSNPSVVVRQPMRPALQVPRVSSIEKLGDYRFPLSTSLGTTTTTPRSTNRSYIRLGTKSPPPPPPPHYGSPRVKKKALSSTQVTVTPWVPAPIRSKDFNHFRPMVDLVKTTRSGEDGVHDACNLTLREENLEKLNSDLHKRFAKLLED
eukprot:TRINITY_DN3772_c1_g1_i1.p1 TRINITY_DN3772_c1_g1~~TRINITY_DN3772_c1_g1_i1.p1  ORF type:complete len:345 (+),score=45.74 TRINITY_DN3772_c1_g1_i1:48-1082(+)